MKQLAIVVPCYNEEEVLPTSSKKLLVKLNSMIDEKLISDTSFIIFIDDGSKDQTWNIITKLHQSNPKFQGLKLATNKGHQFALLSGLNSVTDHCDVSISIDSDLQDDIDVMDQMIKKFLEGNEIVYAVRKKRKTDTWFKKASAQFFYKLMLGLGVQIIYDHADYRLTGKKALQSLLKYQESNLFLRGIFPHIGFKHDTVEYERLERYAGESKYPLKKMISFALEGITSFSVVPLRIVSSLGLIAILFSTTLSGWVLYQHMTGKVIQGWSSTILSIYFLGSIQLLSLGLIGEYIGKIYKEIKARPRFLIDELTLKK